MKIIAAVRTLNEESNIADFCASYDWADMVLVADGGSDDDTVAIAGLFPNAWVRPFDERVELPDGTWFNPEPRHVNFLIDWAVEEDADWIIFDDSDCRPNVTLREDAREIIENAKEPAIHLHRLYIWGRDQYFPKYNVSTSLWAWRPAELPVRWQDGPPTNFRSQVQGLDPDRALHLEAPPYCCLHYFAPDEETVQRKLARYAAWGHPQVHPLESIYAPPEPLPAWAAG